MAWTGYALLVGVGEVGIPNFLRWVTCWVPIEFLCWTLVSSTGPALWFVVAHWLDTYQVLCGTLWLTGLISVRFPIWDSSLLHGYVMGHLDSLA
eukprot:4779678-Ditylum_brightwellii.AAC.1